jgi:hypothetical protein
VGAAALDEQSNSKEQELWGRKLDGIINLGQKPSNKKVNYPSWVMSIILQIDRSGWVKKD